MKFRKQLFTIAAVLAGSATLPAQDTHRELRKGDRNYLSGNYSEAEGHYRDAASEEKGNYNLGNALYQQKRYEEAVKKYSQILEDPDASEKLKRDARFNLGNAYYQLKDYGKSVEAYRQFLREQPDDREAVENLWKAWKKLQAMQQRQQKNKQQQGGEEKDRQEGQQDQPQNQKNNTPGDGEEGEEPTPAGRELRDAEAEQLLEIVERQDERVREKLRKGTGKDKKPEKDW